MGRRAKTIIAVIVAVVIGLLVVLVAATVTVVKSFTGGSQGAYLPSLPDEEPKLAPRAPAPEWEEVHTSSSRPVFHVRTCYHGDPAPAR